MAIEPVTDINDLDPTNPSATDLVSEGDDHIRNIKTALKNNLANIGGAVTATHTQLDYVTQIGDSSNVAYGDALIAGKRTDTNAVAFTLHGYNENRIANMVTDYGLDNTGGTDCSTLINNAIADNDIIYFPEGTYQIDSAIWIDKSNFVMIGAGSKVCTLKHKASGSGNYTMLDARTGASGANGSMSNVMIKGFTLDGNKANHSGTGNNCLMLLVDSDTHSITGFVLKDLICKNAKNAGILLEGYKTDGLDDSYRVERTLIRDCIAFDNAGVGISQFKVSNTAIQGCLLYDNGLENLTIDIYSKACIVDGNRFFKHLGGTGNIGVDASDSCVISNNFIDNENDETATLLEHRNGIAVNAQHAKTDDIIITGNVVARCKNKGIYVRDDTGFGGSPAGGFALDGATNGSAVITNNVVTTSGVADLAIEDGTGPFIVKNNKFGSLLITDTDPGHVRMGPAEVAWAASMGAGQGPITTTGWHTVEFSALDNNRLCSIGSNQVTIPVGGYYTIAGKVRFTTIGTDVEDLSIQVVTPAKSYIYNVDNTDTTNLIEEISFSFTDLITQGVVYVQARYLPASTGAQYKFTIDDTSTETFFTGVLVG